MSARRSRRTRSQLTDESSASDAPTSRPSQRHSSRLRHSSHGPSSQHRISNISIVAEGSSADDDATPRVATRSRRAASTIPIQKSSRRLIRPSLMGSQVEEMDINRRAEIVGDVAADCLAKLVRAGLEGEWPVNGKGKGKQSEWELAWESLQALRTNQLFPPHAPPFPSFTDVVQSYHPSVQASLNGIDLARAVDLSNLATLLYTILRPDDAAELARALHNDEDDSDARGKGKGVARIVAARKRVSRRNSMLVLAWKRFWFVVVPRDKRDSENALNLWLDFATQIALTYQAPSIEPPWTPDPSLKPLPESQLQDLFSPSAVLRYGQWTIDEETSDAGEASAEGVVKESVERKWARLAKRREKELHDVDVDILIQRHPWDFFRQEMMAFVRHEFVGTALLSRKRLSSRPTVPYESDAESATELATAAPLPHLGSRDELFGIDDPTRAYHPDLEDPAELEETDGSLGEETSGSEDGNFETAPQDVLPSPGQYVPVPGLGEGMELELDMFALAVNEMEPDLDRSEDVRKSLSPGRPPPPKLKSQSPRKPLRRLRNADEDTDEWRVRDAQVSTSTRRSLPPRSEARGFDWRARQADAVQVGWESQTPSPGPPRLTGQERMTTPRARYEDFSPSHLLPSSLSRLTGARSASPSTREGVTPTKSALRKEATASPRLLDSAPRLARQSLTPRPRQPELRPASELIRIAEDVPGAALGSASDLMLDVGADPAVSAPDLPAEPEREQPVMQDLMPDLSELDGIAHSSTTLRTPPTDQEAVLDFAPPVALSVNDPVEIHNPGNEVADVDVAVDEFATSPARPADKVPTSQRILSNTYPRRSRDVHEFATPGAESDEEDRQLLRPRPVAPSASVTTPRRHTAIVVCTPDVLIPPPLPSTVRRGTKHDLDEGDPYLVDVDGTPLTSDPTHVIPEGHQVPRTVLHGQRSGQSTSYSRLSGKRKWTKAEELLLYRTVQKVPLSEAYPLRVVWYLHGEYGVQSKELEWFNPQHMKDKMRVVVRRRENEGNRVEGRARAWLPAGSLGKLQWEEEMEAWRREEDERQKERLRAKKEDEESELAVEGEEELSDDEVDAIRGYNGVADRQRRGKRRRRGGSISDEDLDGLDSDDGEEHVAGRTAKRRRPIGKAAVKAMKLAQARTMSISPSQRVPTPRRKLFVEIPSRRTSASVTHTASPAAGPARSTRSQRQMGRRSGQPIPHAAAPRTTVPRQTGKRSRAFQEKPSVSTPADPPPRRGRSGDRPPPVETPPPIEPVTRPKRTAAALRSSQTVDVVGRTKGTRAARKSAPNGGSRSGWGSASQDDDGDAGMAPGKGKGRGRGRPRMRSAGSEESQEGAEGAERLLGDIAEDGDGDGDEDKDEDDQTEAADEIVRREMLRRKVLEGK